MAVYFRFGLFQGNHYYSVLFYHTTYVYKSKTQKKKTTMPDYPDYAD